MTEQGGREAQDEGDTGIHTADSHGWQQKLTQHWEQIILQLKKKVSPSKSKASFVDAFLS